MRVRMGLLTRRPDLGTDAFRRHWREVHGPVAARLPGLLRYQQNHLIARLPVEGVPGGSWSLDGISALWFAEGTDMRALAATPAYGAVAVDEPRCMLPSRVIVADRHVVLPEPDAACPKAMLLLSRAPGLGAAGFAAAWLSPAGLPAVPGLAGCTLSLVTDRIARDATSGDDEIPVDAVAELWFAAAPPDRLALAAAAARVTGSAAAWMAEMHPVV
jgi:uncharacterized protein (TIGR02118 family)